MERLDEARTRLEGAIAQLEAAIEAQAENAKTDQTLEALDTLRREHATLRQTAGQVSEGIDEITARLREILGEDADGTTGSHMGGTTSGDAAATET